MLDILFKSAYINNAFFTIRGFCTINNLKLLDFFICVNFSHIYVNYVRSKSSVLKVNCDSTHSSLHSHLNYKHCLLYFPI